MNEFEARQSPLMLLGIGGAGGAIAAGVSRAYNGAMRYLVVDTDSRSNPDTGVGSHFLLVGGNRLAGVGSGGNVANASSAVRDDVESLDSRMSGVRTAVVVAGLGGGTGGGATVEIVKHLRQNGIATLLFATIPFGMEGPEVKQNALRVKTVLEDEADVPIFIELDKLVAATGTDNMKEAYQRGTDTLASGITLLWRLLEKPGYIKLDGERLHNIIVNGGPARFATATARGDNRAEAAVKELKNSPLLRVANAPRARAALVGVLAGDDLRLSEVGTISNGVRFEFTNDADLALGTVNDEETFSGRLSVVALIFGEGLHAHAGSSSDKRGSRNLTRRPAIAPNRFGNADKTFWKGEDLDVPTYVREGIHLDR